MKTGFFKGLFLALVVIVATSCADAYKKVIPADTFMVAEVDLKAIAVKSDIQSQQTRVSDLIQTMVQEEQQLQPLVDLLNVKKLGLKWQKPLYLFSVQEDVYMVAAVDNKAELEKNLISLSPDLSITIADADGISWIEEREQLFGALTTNALLIGSSTSKSDYRELLMTSDEDTFFEVEAGKFMKQHKGDITMTINMPACPSSYKRDFYKEMEKELGDLDDWGIEDILDQLMNLQLVANLTAEPGKIACNIHYSGLTAGQKRLFSEVSVAEIKRVPEEGLLGLFACVLDGPQYLAAVEDELEELSDQLSYSDRELMDVVVNFVKQVDGTAVAALLNDMDDPDLICLIPTPKKEFKRLLGETDTDLPSDLYLDGENSTSILTSIFQYDYNEVNTPFAHASNAEGSYVYFYFDLEQLMDYACDDMVKNAARDEKQVVREVQTALTKLDYTELSVKKHFETSWTIYWNDKSQNAWAVLLEDLLNIAEEAEETYN